MLVEARVTQVVAELAVRRESSVPQHRYGRGPGERPAIVSGKITRIELHIPSVSEKNLQSIKAMGKVPRLRGYG